MHTSKTRRQACRPTVNEINTFFSINNLYTRYTYHLALVSLSLSMSIQFFQFLGFFKLVSFFGDSFSVVFSSASTVSNGWISEDLVSEDLVSLDLVLLDSASLVLASVDLVSIDLILEGFVSVIWFLTESIRTGMISSGLISTDSVSKKFFCPKRLSSAVL